MEGPVMVTEDVRVREREAAGERVRMLLHCLFAMVFAASIIGVLNAFGFLVRTSSCCPPASTYTTCDMWQDFRSLMSFLLGALFCCVFTRDHRNTEVRGKVRLYTCLL